MPLAACLRCTERPNDRIQRRSLRLGSIRRHLGSAASALLLFSWLLSTCSEAWASPAPKRPNILLIVSDDQAWTDHGHMGHPSIRTPHLDRLASRSLCFTRGYVPSSLCCPSLASLITGRYPHQHGVVCNDPPRPAGLPSAEFYRSDAYRSGRERLSSFLEQTPTLPRLFRDQGYLSFQSGKWWQNHYSRGGFTHGMTRGDRHGDAGLEIGRVTMKPIEDFVEMAEREERPWLVWYAPMMPHDPHTPPERFLARHRGTAPSLPIAKYRGMVEWFDDTCGQLLDFLDKRGSAENTIVVFVTDNGWITDPQTGRYAPKSKQSPYDGGLRTPILVGWPGRVKPQRDETHAVSSLDLMPTLLRAAGVKPPDGLPGINLLDPKAVRSRASVSGECFTHDAVNLDHPESGLRWRWIVRDGWKLILPTAWNEPTAKPELYRIIDDPLEQTDLAAQHPLQLRRLRQELEKDWKPAWP